VPECVPPSGHDESPPRDRAEELVGAGAAGSVHPDGAQNDHREAAGGERVEQQALGGELRDLVVELRVAGRALVSGLLAERAVHAHGAAVHEAAHAQVGTGRDESCDAADIGAAILSAVHGDGQVRGGEMEDDVDALERCTDRGGVGDVALQTA
jgi:hypothetical protein